MNDDERFLTLNGRRWRRSDPSIPDSLRVELVAELMAARRSVAAAGRAGDEAARREARRRVQDAKTALGERGRPWWEEPGAGADAARIEATIRTLLRHRPGGTICPSDVARVVGGTRWRALLPQVRTVALALAHRGELSVRQRSAQVENLDAIRGPIRLASD